MFLIHSQTEAESTRPDMVPMLRGSASSTTQS